MVKNDNISKNMTIRYAIAVAIIALTVLSAYIFMQYKLYLNESKGHVINVSGMQRMLSQRIAFFASNIAQKPNAEYEGLLRDAIQKMDKNHGNLVKGNSEEEIFGEHSPAIEALYFSSPDGVDILVKNYLSHAEKFLDAYKQRRNNSNLENNPDLIAMKLLAPEKLLNALDAVVKQHEKEAKDAILELKIFETIMLCAAFIILTLEVLFIFRPMVAYISHQITSLHKSREKAEELSRLKSDFLATMSHEIRTPMNGILGMAELIQNARPSLQIESYARTIINSGETLMNIIGDILDFSKIEAGKMELDPMPVNLLELADEMTELYSVKARDKAIELVVRYMPGSEQFVFADPVRLRQILGNLIDNAIKFTDKGYVSLTIEEDKNYETTKDEVHLKFSVSDSGIGLSREAQARIFEKFSQADSSTTRKYGGTGLGLSISQSLVNMMGGNIQVTSKAGKGTTFSFTLLLKRNTKEALDEPDIPLLKNLRVLIVDDLEVVRELVKEQLRYTGIHCEDAPDGKEALQKMLAAHEQNTPYSMVIIDYLMPDMNGEMLASAINDHPSLRSACLVMLTAAGNPLADEHFVQKGFSAFISKPVKSHAFIRALALIWSKYSNGQTNTLIRLDTAQHEKRPEKQNSSELPGTKILLAEDNLVNQVFIKEILQEMKAEYTIVSDGKEALKAVSEEDFSLIIMDCLMPVMDGFEASRNICKLKDEGIVRKNTPILALTANAMKGDREKCLKAGMDDYLAKPVRQKELKEKIFSLISDKPKKKKRVTAQIITFDTSDKEPPVSLANIAGKEQPKNLLDTEAIENARKILKDKYESMVDVYFRNTREYIEEIMQAIQNDDIEAIIRPAHTLKSTSKQMGALRLSDISKNIEYMAKSISSGTAENGETIEDIYKILDQMTGVMLETRKAFQRLAA